MEEPVGELSLRTLAMPGDTNPAGDIFGGWLLSQMDIAGALSARAIAKGRVATVAIDSMKFHKPVKVGDILCCYCEIVRIGTTSTTIKVHSWVTREGVGPREKVTEGVYTFVALNEDGTKRPLPAQDDRAR